MSDRFETQERLIAATRKVMVHHGIEGCTLERICTEAGYSRGAFYSNFGDKEDLFTLVAQDEYDTTVARLNRVLQQWQSQLKDNPETLGEDADHLEKMNMLLGKALSELKLDRDYFIVHNELLVRAIRVPEWGLQFRNINREFVLSMGRVLNQILNVVGRKMTRRPEAVAQAVIGVVLRSTGYDAWQQPDLTASDPTILSETVHSIPTGDEINDLIVMLLESCSEPIPNPNQDV